MLRNKRNNCFSHVKQQIGSDVSITLLTVFQIWNRFTRRVKTRLQDVSCNRTQLIWKWKSLFCNEKVAWIVIIANEAFSFHQKPQKYDIYLSFIVVHYKVETTLLFKANYRLLLSVHVWKRNCLVKQNKTELTSILKPSTTLFWNWNVISLYVHVNMQFHDARYFRLNGRWLIGFYKN